MAILANIAASMRRIGAQGKTYLLAAAKKLTLLQILLALITLPTLLYFFREAWHVKVVVDPITVPPRFTEIGITPDTMSTRVAAAMRLIEARAHSQVANDLLAPSQESAVLGDSAASGIEVPGTKVSLKSIAELLQTVLGRAPTHISGDVVLSQPQKDAAGPSVAITTVHLHRADNSSRFARDTVDADDIDVLVYRTAQSALLLLNPYMAAVDRSEHQDFQGATTLIKQIVSDPRTDGAHLEAAYLLWASVLRNRHRYKESADKLLEAKRLNSNNPALYITWGSLFADQQKWPEAIEQFQIAVKLDPQSPRGYNALGVTYAALRSRDLGNNPNYYRASLGYYAKAITIDRCFSLAYYNRAVLLEGQSNNDEAAENYERAVDCDPQYLLPYKNWSRLEANRGRFRAAAEIWERAIQADPYSSTVYSAWGSFLASIRKFNEALEKFQVATKLDPRSSAYYLGWGDAFYDNHEYAAAVQKYERALDIDDDSAMAHNNLGNALRSIGHCRKATSEYARASAIRPDLSFPDRNQAVVLSKQQHYVQARTQFESVLKRTPQDGVGHADYARMLADEKQYDQADAEYRQALLYNHTDPFIYRDFVRTLLAERKMDEAEKMNERYATLLAQGDRNAESTEPAASCVD